MSSGWVSCISYLTTGILSALVGSIATAYFTKKNKDKKELSLQSTYPSNLVSFSKDISSRIQIFLDGTEVIEPSICDVSIANTGTIELTDFNVLVEAPCKILSCEHLSCNFPMELENIKVNILNDNKSISLYFGCLNQAEEISYRLLISKKVSVKISSRKNGVTVNTSYGRRSEFPNVLSQSFFDSIMATTLLDLYFTSINPVYRKYRETKKRQDK